MMHQYTPVVIPLPAETVIHLRQSYGKVRALAMVKYFPILNQHDLTAGNADAAMDEADHVEIYICIHDGVPTTFLSSQIEDVDADAPDAD